MKCEFFWCPRIIIESNNDEIDYSTKFSLPLLNPAEKDWENFTHYKVLTCKQLDNC